MIVLVPYNSIWPELFAAEKEKLKQKLAEIIIAIEHIGSTAIPGIHAKPIIDILIGVKDLSQFNAKHIQLIESLDYQYIPAFENELPYRRFFQKCNAQGERTYQIHLVNYHSSWWQRHILFCDYLRKNPPIAKEYETHKLQLATQYDNSNQYAQAKTEFCRTIDRNAFFDFTINHQFLHADRVNAYIPQLACFDAICAMHQDKAFIDCFGVEFDREKIYQNLIDDIAHWEHYGFGSWIWYINNDNQFVGRAGLKKRIIDGNEEVELAYAISFEFWGKGFAVEMSLAAIKFAFDVIKLPDIICFTLATNKQSLRVIEKLRFTYEKDFIHYNLPHKLFRLKNPGY